MPNHGRRVDGRGGGGGALSYLKQQKRGRLRNDVFERASRSLGRGKSRPRIRLLFSTDFFWAPSLRSFVRGKIAVAARPSGTRARQVGPRPAAPRARVRVRTSRRRRPAPILEIRVFQPSIPGNLMFQPSSFVDYIGI